MKMMERSTMGLIFETLTAVPRMEMNLLMLAAFKERSGVTSSRLWRRA